MRNCTLFISFLAFLFLVFDVSAETRVIRGPYLQQPTPSSIIIRWRTDAATDAKVYYGTDISNLSLTATSAKDTTDHTVKITGLSPYTKYFYSVGSSAQQLSGPDSMQYFYSSPLAGTVQPIRLWAIGDFGKGSEDQRIVRDSYLQYTGNTHTDLWLWLGDNAYPDATDQEFQDKVFDSITGYHRLFKYMPFMPTPGNHDYNSICPIPCFKDPQTHTGPYYDIVDVPKEGEAGGVPSHTELYYSFDYGNIHFISLNSELGSPARPWDYNGVYNSQFVTSPVVEWLKADLAATDKTWKIAFWHQCPYSGQDVNSDDFWEIYIHAMRDRFNPILESYGVDLVLTGHDHDYQRTYLIHGLYGGSGSFDSATNIINGTSGNDSLGEPYIKYTNGPDAGIGTVYVVEGNSGAGNPEGPIRHPELWGGDACGTCIGSLVVDVNGNRLDAKYLKGSGEIGDHFTIIKQAATSSGTHLGFQQKLNVYPNPFTESTQVDFYAGSNENYQLDIHDMQGKLVWSKQLKTTAAGYQSVPVKLDASLADGTYVLDISGTSGTAHRNIIKF